ncbi:RNA-binding protein 2 [Linum perenne]
MADGYWNRQQQQQPPHLPAGGMLKRPRNEYDMQNSGPPAGYEMNNYYGAVRDDGASNQHVKDTKTIGSAYDRYLQNQGLPALGGDGFARNIGGGMGGLPAPDSSVMGRSRATGGPPNMPVGGFGGHRPAANTMPRSSRDTVPLPPDASNTLYVEGLPHDCTRREVAHIFRPFVGYKDLRLVSKESKHVSISNYKLSSPSLLFYSSTLLTITAFLSIMQRGEPIILCFVDFIDSPCAATAMSALQGYRMDEHDPESSFLKLQFSRYPGPRSGMAGRGKR